MIKKPLFSFDNVNSTGLDTVPLNATIIIEDSSSGANEPESPKLIYIFDQTNITGSTTIGYLLSNLTNQWAELGGSGEGVRDVTKATATAGQTVFSCTYDDADNTDVFLNGVKMLQTDQYTLTSGNTLTLESGAQVGDFVEVLSFYTIDYPVTDADTLDSFNGTYYLDWDNFTDTPSTLAGYGLDAVAAPLASPTFTGTVTLPSGTDTVVKDTSPTLGGNLDMYDKYIIGLMGYQYTSTSANLDLVQGNIFYINVTGNFTQTFSNEPTSGKTTIISVELQNAGAHTITWDTNIKWAGGTAPGFTTSGKDIVTLYTRDGGINWYGSAQLDYS